MWHRLLSSRRQLRAGGQPMTIPVFLPEMFPTGIRSAAFRRHEYSINQ